MAASHTHYQMGAFGLLLCLFRCHAWNFNGRCWYCGKEREASR
jgi:hypothetical protein